MFSRKFRAALTVVLGAILAVGNAATPAYADTNVSLPLNVNFQAPSTTTPSGYLGDSGQAYSATRGYGWTDSTGAALDLTANGRERNVAADKRLDTFIQMQLLPEAPGNHVDGYWKAAVPNGTYTVTVAAGDPSYTNSHNVLRVEGQVALDFTPTGTTKSQVGTVTVAVTDGFLNVDAVGGTNTKINYVQAVAASATTPHVTAVDPANGASNVSTSAAVTVQLSDGVSAASVNSTSLQLFDPNNNQITGFYNVDGAYSNATFVPSSPLSANTQYRVQTTAALKDPQGDAYTPFSSTFTTGTSGVTKAPVNFSKSVLDVQNGPTAMTIGPDGALYVATVKGDILKYTLDADGKKVGNPTHISNFLFSRIITSIKFDPSSTATNMKLWVSHGYLCDGDCADFTGMVSVLTGTNLSTRRDVITGLPRSIGNHMNNGIEFGADGKLYIAQGANNGFGAPDAIWGNRAEDPLSAAILVADVNGDARFQSTVNVNTSTGYDANATNAPVKIFASGVRNAFSIIAASNGKLYSPVNESANGNAPAGPNNNPPALTDLPAGTDYFTELVAGKYYGHPNPSRGQYTLNGANPTAGVDPFEVPQYPVGTPVGANYRAPDLNLGQHRSANAGLEYKSNVFGGTLKGQILLTEYSQGKDLIAITTDANGKPNGSTQVADGFYNPLGVASDAASGRIYVAEFGADPTGDGGQITLLTPVVDNNPPTGTTIAKVNFGAQSTTPPTGYSADYGQAYDDTRGYGWETTTGTPLSLVGNGRERNAVADKRLDSFIHMQLPNNGAAGVTTEGRWEIKVANGTYTVTVGAGDPKNTDSRNVLRAEGNVILDFTPDTTTFNKVATAQVVVSDGKLTIDATGGTNTKIDYIDISGTTTTPTGGLVAAADFAPQSSTAATGYTLDYGQAFDPTRGFGWEDLNGVPLSLVGNARERGVLSDKRLDNFIHMQLPAGSAGVATPGRWEVVVPNATYKVTVGVGDPSFINSTHVIRAEGQPFLSYTPTTAAPNKIVTANVTVADGRLTLDAVGGDNTKIDFVDVYTLDGNPTPTDTTPPTGVITPSGTTNSSGAFVGSASVAIAGSDTGSGVKNITYILDTDVSKPYNAPFTVSTTGSHTVVATITDNAGNTAQVTKTFTIAPPVTGPTTISVTGTEDYLGLGNLVVLSTVGYEVRPGKAVVIKNTGTSPLNITNLAVSGPQAGSFTFNSGQAKNFTIAGGATASVTINFIPVQTYVNTGTLTISSNDAVNPSYKVALGGMNPATYEGDYEPSVQQITDTFGFTSNIGVTGTPFPNSIGTTAAPAGDEVSSAYWKRLDTTKPANLYPLAHYSGRSTGSVGPFSWYAKGSTTNNNLLYFPGGSDISGGENQRLTPKIGGGGTTAFSPTTSFGLFDGGSYSDDAKNASNTHNLRFYPAKNASGAVIPGSYIVAHDIGPAGTQYKNWDYQDYVFLLTNVAPDIAAAPGAAALNLSFNAAVSGTVADSASKGTGFTSVQANTAGDQLLASNLNLDTATGRLKVTSTAGSNTNTTNNQRNALQLSFDATKSFRQEARLIGPFTNLNSGSQQEAIFFGPDQENYIKFEVENVPGGAVSLTIWLETNGQGAIVQRIAMPNSAASTLDLRFDGNPTARTVQASYRVASDTAAFTNLGTPTAVPAGWFNTSNAAGIIVSNSGSATPIVASYDWFRVLAN